MVSAVGVIVCELQKEGYKLHDLYQKEFSGDATKSFDSRPFKAWSHSDPKAKPSVWGLNLQHSVKLKVFRATVNGKVKSCPVKSSCLRSHVKPLAFKESFLLFCFG